MVHKQKQKQSQNVVVHIHEKVKPAKKKRSHRKKKPTELPQMPSPVILGGPKIPPIIYEFPVYNTSVPSRPQEPVAPNLSVANRPVATPNIERGFQQQTSSVTFEPNRPLRFGEQPSPIEPVRIQPTEEGLQQREQLHKEMMQNNEMLQKRKMRRGRESLLQQIERESERFQQPMEPTLATPVPEPLQAVNAAPETLADILEQQTPIRESSGGGGGRPRGRPQGPTPITKENKIDYVFSRGFIDQVTGKKYTKKTLRKNDELLNALFEKL
jgi:hypothetical protein